MFNRQLNYTGEIEAHRHQNGLSVDYRQCQHAGLGTCKEIFLSLCYNFSLYPSIISSLTVYLLYFLTFLLEALSHVLSITYIFLWLSLTVN